MAKKCSPTNRSATDQSPGGLITFFALTFGFSRRSCLSRMIDSLASRCSTGRNWVLNMALALHLSLMTFHTYCRRCAIALWRNSTSIPRARSPSSSISPLARRMIPTYRLRHGKARAVLALTRTTSWRQMLKSAACWMRWRNPERRTTPWSSLQVTTVARRMRE